MPVMTLGKLCGAPINWTKPLRDGLAAAASHFGDGEVLDKDLECLKLLLSAPAMLPGSVFVNRRQARRSGG